MVETSGNGNASNLINLKRPFNNTRINVSDIGTRHSDPKSIIQFGKHSVLGHQNKHFHIFCFFSFMHQQVTNVLFISYLTCWNCCWTWNLCFLLNFQLKKNQIEKNTNHSYWVWSFISFELRHLNSLKVSQNAKFGRSFFSAEN